MALFSTTNTFTSGSVTFYPTTYIGSGTGTSVSTLIRQPTEVERLLADVEAVCALGRAA